MIYPALRYLNDSEFSSSKMSGNVAILYEHDIKPDGQVMQKNTTK